jgi:mannose-6-phosphate isomerase-like protein (cupin superfamily)
MGDVLRLGPRDSLEIVGSGPAELLVIASYVPLGSPPPAHLHPAQDERFEVLEGRMRAKLDGEELEIAAGETLEVPAGSAHQMWNPAERPARVRWSTRPGLRTESWFRELDSIFAEDGAIAKGREIDFGALLEEYADVFRLADA